MNPNEAAATAAELADHMAILAGLDLAPIANARRIQTHRALAQECVTALSAYLVTSDAFVPVTA